MGFNDDERIELRKRVKRARGQADGVLSMLEYGEVLGDGFA